MKWAFEIMAAVVAVGFVLAIVGVTLVAALVSKGPTPSTPEDTVMPQVTVVKSGGHGNEVYLKVVEFAGCEWIVGTSNTSNPPTIVHKTTCKFCAERAKATK